MKIPSLAVTALTLLANSGGAVAHSSSSSAAAPISSSRRSKYLPWTRAKIYNPVGGETAAMPEPESSVLLGQDEEASESLSVSIPLSQSRTLSANDAPLMRDIEMLTEILSDLVKHENAKLYELAHEFIDYGRQRCVRMNWFVVLKRFMPRMSILLILNFPNHQNFACTVPKMLMTIVHSTP